MKRFLFLLFFALILRLFLLPYTSVTNEGDSVARIFLAWHWLDHPEWITHAGWGPLHFYLIAGAVKLWFNPVFSPSVLHILISVATAIPLWAFVRREWNEPAALFVAAAFLFYPLSFRLSFMPASEVPFGFFVVLAMYFVSRARSQKNVSDALFAGLSLTLASALRVEAWILIVLFGCLLWGNWRLLLIYLFAASIFPVFWMIGNVTHGYDAISQLAAARDWQLKIEGINENLTFFEILRRLIYFPAVVFFGLTPPIAILSLVGIYFAWPDKVKRLWIIPFAVLVLIFIVRTAQGLVTTQARYSLLLGCLLLPFSASTIMRFQDKSWIRGVAFACILFMIPLSYCRVALHRLAGGNFPNPFPADLQAIPKIDSQTKEIVRIVNANLKESDGLLIDFFGKDFYGWKDTYYVALMSHLHPSRIVIMPGGRHQPVDVSELSGFFRKNPSGLLLRSDNSRFIHLTGTQMNIDGYGHALLVRRITSIKSITIYEYKSSGPGLKGTINVAPTNLVGARFIAPYQ